MTPRRHQSGTSINCTSRVTKRGDIGAREALCEAAAAILLRPITSDHDISVRWSAREVEYAAVKVALIDTLTRRYLA
jgi:transposase